MGFQFLNPPTVRLAVIGMNGVGVKISISSTNHDSEALGILYSSFFSRFLFRVHTI